jgi:mannose-1-phosphate guanylyltransferase/mannose-1-phosphate guanylyltransferase/mannose-6-phosphate isomerase
MIHPPSIHPIILCGGSGTRLWPVSRTACPKPFLPLIGATTLFEQAIARVAGDAGFAAPIVVAGAQHVDLIEAQWCGAQGARLVIEPCARNTAPAIALAAALIDPADIMLVCPSDHHIADPAAFRAAAAAAADLARGEWLVSFGIAATHPETGYGYLHRGEPLPGGYRIERFVEKPDLERARAYLASGEYSWNGGIFAFRAGALLAELAAHRPQMAALVAQAVAEGQTEGARFHPAAQPFAAIAGESIDYAVMESTARAAMVPADMGWSDIGNWAALHDALGADGDGADPHGNVARGAADMVGCRNVLAFSDGPRVSVIGLTDVCIVVNDGEVLVTTREGAQAVGKLPGATNQ